MSQFRGYMVEVVLRQLIQQMGVGVVGENVLAGVRHFSRVKVGVGKLKFVGANFSEKNFVVIERVVDAGDVEIFCFVCGNLKVKRLERANLGNEL